MYNIESELRKEIKDLQSKLKSAEEKIDLMEKGEALNPSDNNKFGPNSCSESVQKPSEEV